MFEFFLSHTAHLGHLDTSFVGPRGMGLDDPITAQHGTSINGPVEYVFKIGTSPAMKNDEGVLVPTNALKTTFISFLGSKGATDMIPIKSTFKSAAVGEFSAIAKDVGPVKAIKLSEPFSKNAQWRPTTVEVNRIGPSGAKDALSKPDGWVGFDVNRVVKEPVTIMARGPASGT
jgi:hypothetical protein